MTDSVIADMDDSSEAGPGRSPFDAPSPPASVGGGESGAPLCACGAALEVRRVAVHPIQTSGANPARHVLCLACQSFVRTRVRNWFARRFGSRFADRIDDFVHDLYVEQLLRPGGLATFVPPSATSDRYLAFRKFLSVVVKNFCLNKCQKVGRMLARESFDDPPERRHARTGDVEFVRYCALAVVKRSYERLRERYAKRGRPQYFAVLAPVLIGPEPDYAEIARQLGQKRDSVRRSKKSMWAHWRRELRSTVADTLNLPLSMDRELRRKLIDEEIRQLLQALFDEGDEDD